MKKRWGPRNLKEAVSRMSLVHTEEIVPIHMFTLPRQLDFEGLEKDSNDHVLGFFYELITKGIYGGELSNHIRHVEGGKEVNHLMPDLINHEKKIIIESKARRSNKSFNLRDNQIEKYGILQEKYPDFKTYFALYSHLVSSTKEYKESKTELFEKLADKTLCSIVLPFSLVLGLNRCRDSDLVSRFEKGRKGREKHDISTTPHQKTMALLYHRPEFVIELFGLKSEDYQINRFVSPDGFLVANNLVEQFPILKISSV